MMKPTKIHPWAWVLSTIIQFVMFFALNAQSLTCIDMTQAKFENKNAEEIFKDFEIVPLETHKNGLLLPRASYYLTDRYIIGVNFPKNGVTLFYFVLFKNDVHYSSSSGKL